MNFIEFLNNCDTWTNQPPFWHDVPASRQTPCFFHEAALRYWEISSIEREHRGTVFFRLTAKSLAQRTYHSAAFLGTPDLTTASR